MKFAKAYLYFTSEDWAKVIFSNESTFQCIRACRSKVWKLEGSSRFNRCHTIKTAKRL